MQQENHGRRKMLDHPEPRRSPEEKGTLPKLRRGTEHNLIFWLPFNAFALGAGMIQFIHSPYAKPRTTEAADHR
jgi:hypothetical protein